MGNGMNVVKKLNHLTIGVLVGMSFMTVSSSSWATTVPLKQTLERSADYIGSSHDITRMQNMSSGQAVVQSVEKANIEQMAIDHGKKVAEKMVSTSEELTLGLGLGSSLRCDVQTDVRVEENKIQVAKAIARSEQKKFIGQAVTTPAFLRRAERHERHKLLFCGQSEVRNGECLFGVYNQPNADVSFSNIVAHKSMSEYELEGAYDFIRNLVTIGESVSSQCTTQVCQDVRAKEQEYNSYASSVQDVFLQRVHERTNSIDPVRPLEIIYIDQVPEELSGDNWRPEHGTVHPDGKTVIRGGDKGSTGRLTECTTTEGETTSVPIKTLRRTYFVGDGSIVSAITKDNSLNASDTTMADGFLTGNNFAKTEGDATPRGVRIKLDEAFKDLEKWAEKAVKTDKKDPNKAEIFKQFKNDDEAVKAYLHDAIAQTTFFITTGVINDPTLKERADLEGLFVSLSKLTQAGARVVVAGVPNNLDKNKPELAVGLNDMLKNMSASHKLGFAGAYESDDGKLLKSGTFIHMFGLGLARLGLGACFQNECVNVEESIKQDKAILSTAEPVKKSIQQCTANLTGTEVSASSTSIPNAGEMFGHPVFDKIPQSIRADVQQLMYLIAKGEVSEGLNARAFNRYYCNKREWWQKTPFKNDPTYIITERTFDQLLVQLVRGNGDPDIRKTLDKVAPKDVCGYGAIYTAGLYQFTAGGMYDIKFGRKSIYERYKNEKFSPAVQSAINLEYFLTKKRPLLRKFFSGNTSMSVNDIMDDISAEWSSVGNSTCNKNLCIGGAKKKERPDYAHTMEIRAVIERLHLNIKRENINLNKLLEGK